MAGGKTNTPANSLSRFRDYIVPVLSLVVGVLVLLPTAIGPVLRPIVFGWLLPTYVVLALLSAVSLAAALLLSGWELTSAHPYTHRAHGFGNFCGVFSLVAAAIFLGANYVEDIVAAPRILNVKVNPVQPETGKVVEVELEVVNRTGRPLAFDWEFDGRSIPGLRTAYIKMPSKAGSYLVTIAVRNVNVPAFVLESGASASATSGKSHQADVAPSVRVWLEVADSDSTARPGNGAGAGAGASSPAKLTKIEIESKSHGGPNAVAQ
jgi:hypothetical protein